MPDLALQSAEVYSDFNTPGVASSGEKEPVKREIRELWANAAAQIAAIREGAGGAYIIKETEADLNADLAHAAGTWARVIADDQSPPQNGYYLKSGASGAGAWSFITEDPAVIAALEAQAAAEVAEDAAARIPGCWNSLVTDEYLRRLITEIAVEGGDPADTYVINYETVFFSGISLYRYQFQARSVLTGANIATWSIQGATDPSLDYAPPRIILSNVSDGAVQANYQGTQVVLTINWDALETDKNQTAYTSAAQAGVHPSRIYTPDDMDDFLVSPRPKEVFTVGTGGDYATLLAAFTALQYPVSRLANVARSSFPNSDLVAWSHQVQLVILQGHAETIAAEQVNGLWQSTIVGIPYLSIVCQPDVVFTMEAAGANNAPVMEANFPIWVQGGRWIQNGNGYIFHIDAGNVLTQRSTTAGRLLWKHRHVFKDVELDHRGVNNTSHCFGCGSSNGSTVIIDSPVLIRSGAGIASAAAQILCHNSTDETDPALWILRHGISDDGARPGTGMGNFITAHATTIRNRLIVEDFDAALLLGDDGWVRRGKLSDIPFPPAFDP